LHPRGSNSALHARQIVPQTNPLGIGVRFRAPRFEERKDSSWHTPAANGPSPKHPFAKAFFCQPFPVIGIHEHFATFFDPSGTH
jgi:hypothetical protein